MTEISLDLTMGLSEREEALTNELLTAAVSEDRETIERLLANPMVKHLFKIGALRRDD